MISLVVLLLLSFSSMVSTSGHLRLELTASRNCEVKLITDYSVQIVTLIEAEKRTSSFHPNENQNSIRIGLSVPDSEPVFYQFILNKTDQPVDKTFDPSELVVMLRGVYECNPGFYGDKCQFEGVPTTSTTTTITTTTTVITTTELMTIRPSSTNTGTVPRATSTDSEYYNRINMTLILIIITLSALIIVFGIRLVYSTRPQHIIIGDSTVEIGNQMKLSAEKKCKYLDESTMDEEPRYIADPFAFIKV